MINQKPQAREAMMPVDALWLALDHSANPMVINGIMVFDDLLPFDLLTSLVEERLINQFARFRHRAVRAPSCPAGWYWEDDRHFDVRMHVRQLALPDPGDMATLQLTIGNLISEPLAPGRPQWRIYQIERYGAGSVLLARIHHSIADGKALIRLLLSLSDRELSSRDEEANRTNGTALLASVPAIGRAAHSAKRPLARLRTIAARLAGSTADSHNLQWQLWGRLASAGLLTTTASAILAKLLVMTPDRASPYKGTISGVKRVVWSEPFDLMSLKTIGKALGATINDLLIAAVAGALRKDMCARQGNPDAGDIRALAPVNLRSPADERALGNQFSVVWVRLPVSYSDPGMRLAAVKRQMDRVKLSPEPTLVYQALSILGALPGELATQVERWFADKATCVLSNVRGPSQPICVAGHTVKKLLFWPPLPGEIALGISLLSYNGHMTIGILADDALVKEPGALVKHISVEIEKLGAIATSESRQK